MPKNVRAAMIQHPPVFLNRRESIERAKHLIQEAGDEGARLIVFPECWLPGYPVWLDNAPGSALWDAEGSKQLYRLLSENALDVDDSLFELLQRLADAIGAVIAFSAHLRAGRTLYNAQILTVPGDDGPHVRRKLTPTYTEKLIWGAGGGEGLAAFDSPVGRIGGLICWEHWMPLARECLHRDGEIIHVAQWPSVNEAHMIASRHYAFEGRCFVLAAGTVLTRADVLGGFRSLDSKDTAARRLLESIPGDDDRLVQSGHSAIIGPDGRFVAGPLDDRVGILYGDLSIERLKEENLTLDVAGHYGRPDLFDFAFRPRGA